MNKNIKNKSTNQHYIIFFVFIYLFACQLTV